MKLIIAVIRPDRLEAVEEALRSALEEHDHFRLTVQPVEGHGRAGSEPGQPVQSTGPAGGETARPAPSLHLQLTIGVNESHLESALSAILNAAHTGEPGDGKIFVLPLEDCLRIRTGERGDWAI
jgi:nitrogen regulatory protein P-II 1